ncbi:MAG: hypothetical protein ACXVC6_11045 [Bacteroidia bacterium]
MNKLTFFFVILTIALASCSNNNTEVAEKPKPKGPEITIDKYIYSKDSNNVVTVLYIDGKVSFINGKDTSVIKDGYIQSASGSYKEYSCDFNWKNDSCFITSMDLTLTKIGNPKNLVIQRGTAGE